MVIDVIIAFGGGECCGDISTWVKVSITVPLHEHSSTSEEGGISHNDEGTLYIGEVEDWSSLEVGQQCRKGSLLIGSPHPGLILLG